VNAARAVGDPEPDQPRHARHGKQGPGREKPAAESPPREPANDGAYHRATGCYGGDHVADPVDEVQERSFRLRSGLALDRDVGLRGGAQVLPSRVVPEKK